MIALVITIIVLLILVGVTLSTLSGEDGILKKATSAKENTRGAEVKEYVQFQEIMNEMNSAERKNKKQVIEKLMQNGKLTEKEKEDLETNDIIKIGDIEIDFSKLDKSTKSVPIIDVAGIDEWTKNKKVTILTNSEYTTKYTIDGTEPSSTNGSVYEEPFDINEKCTIKVAYISSDNRIGEIVEQKVEKIDNLPPKTLEYTLTPTKNSIKIEINRAEDEEGNDTNGKSEIKGYRFKKGEGENWTEYQEGTTYTFEELYGNLAGETYNITVEAKDYAGNVKEVQQSTTTICKNTEYYTEKKDDLLCTIGDREYYKNNNVGAIVSSGYFVMPDGTNYSIPILVSTDQSAVTFYTSYNDDRVASSFSVQYGNTKYYYSTSGMAVDDEIISKFPILNTAENRFNWTEEKYLYEMAIALLDKYFSD